MHTSTVDVRPRDTKRPRVDQHPSQLADLTNLARPEPPTAAAAADAAPTCSELQHGAQANGAGLRGVTPPSNTGNGAADVNTAPAASASRWPCRVRNFYGQQHGSSRQTAVELRIQRFLQVSAKQQSSAHHVQAA